MKMTQKQLNEIHYKIDDAKRLVNEACEMFYFYGFESSKDVKVSEHKKLIGKTLSCLETLIGYTTMITGQREGWNPKHPSDELLEKIKWITEKAKR